MFIIGLTGPTGAGKSTVGGILNEAGFYHIDGDKTSRDVTVKGSPALDEIKNAFGEGVISSDGSLDRKMLGSIVFSDKDKLNLLNKIIHKYITQNVKQKFKELEKSGYKGAVIDGAALYESGISSLCDKIIAVISSKERRLKLIMERDNITEAEAQKRIAAQKSDEFYTKGADYIIYNTGTAEDLRIKAKELAAKLTEDM